MNNLHRSRSNKMISGVCGGFGEYFNIDPTIIRIAYIFLGLNSFSTAFIVYLICSIVIPEDDGVIYDDEQYEKNSRNTPLLIGGALIIWGSFSLARIIFPWFSFRILQIQRFWPVLLILLGIYIIFNQRDK